MQIGSKRPATLALTGPSSDDEPGNGSQYKFIRSSSGSPIRTGTVNYAPESPLTSAMKVSKILEDVPTSVSTNPSSYFIKSSAGKNTHTFKKIKFLRNLTFFLTNFFKLYIYKSYVYNLSIIFIFFFKYFLLFGRFLGRHKASATHRSNKDIQKNIFACDRAGHVGLLL